MYCSSIREYGAIEPDTSQISTSRRGRFGLLAVAALEQLAAVAQRGAHRRAQVVLVAAPLRRHGAPRAPQRPAQREPRQQPPRHRPLGVRVGGEVLLAQQLLLAPRGGRGREVGDGRLVAGRRHRDARQRLLGDLAELVERVGRLVGAEHGGERPRERVHLGPGRAQGGAQREVRLGARRRVDGGERALRGEHLAEPDARAVRAHLGGERGDLRGEVGGERREVVDRRGAHDGLLVGRLRPGGAPRRSRSAAARPRRGRGSAPSRTWSRRTRSMSSRTFNATPSVSSSDAAPSSASSARAHVIVSPTPGQLVELAARAAVPRRRRRAPRPPPARPAAACARSRPRVPASGSRSSGTGNAASTRRAARACGSRSAPPAAATRATIVPSSGIVIAKSARNSSRNASNSSSARSISSISSTAGPPSCSSASSSGRRSRNSGPNSSRAGAPASAARIASSWRW